MHSVSCYNERSTSPRTRCFLLCLHGMVMGHADGHCLAKSTPPVVRLTSNCRRKARRGPGDWDPPQALPPGVISLQAHCVAHNLDDATIPLHCSLGHPSPSLDIYVAVFPVRASGSTQSTAPCVCYNISVAPGCQRQYFLSSDLLATPQSQAHLLQLSSLPDSTEQRSVP